MNTLHKFKTRSELGVGRGDVLGPHDRLIRYSSDDADVPTEDVRRAAAIELYEEIFKERADRSATIEKLREDAAKKYGRPIEIVLVRIEPNDKTGSFVKHMKELDKFLGPSKQRFLKDAILHLATLNPEHQKKDMESLSYALAKARYNGHLNEEQENSLAKLQANYPGIDRALNIATTGYFANSIKNLDKFYPQKSGQELLTNAVSRLEGLKNSLPAKNDGKDTTGKFEQKLKLSRAIGHAEYNGHLTQYEETLKNLYKGNKPERERARSDALSDFFSAEIKTIDTFKGSKQQLLKSAITHFGALNAELHPDETRKLSRAFAGAINDGQLLDQEERSLNALVGRNPQIRSALTAGKTDFFSQSIKRIDKFSGSREKLIENALAHLGELNPKDGTEKNAIYRLSHALVSAQSEGHLKPYESKLSEFYEKNPARLEVRNSCQKKLEGKLDDRPRDDYGRCS